MNKGKIVAITTLPITTPKDDAFGCSVSDRTLIDCICKYSDHLRKEGVEVFARKDNVIATEKGYFCAFYEEDLRNAEGGIDNPIPFKGKDGRMKVEIVKEGGSVVTEDLATLVAMAYCPNPKKYKKVWFRDGNPENVNAANLYWVSNFKYFFLSKFHKTK